MDLHALTPAQRRLLAAAALLLVAVFLGFRHFASGAPRAAVPPLRTARPARAAVPAKLVVDVAGAVRRPGLYRLEAGARIADAVAIAGGATRKADVAAVNLAAPLADGEQVLVPARGAAMPAGEGTASSTAPVDLNTASLEQLDTLPGIGPATAQKIVYYRQAHGAFHSLEDLDAVPGIGQGRIAQLKGLAIP